MVLKYATQIAALNSAIAKLDNDLSSNPDWQALNRQPEPSLAQSEGKCGVAPDPIFLQLRLEQSLAQDPVYRARVRLLEAVQVLQQIYVDENIQPSKSGTGSLSRTQDSVIVSETPAQRSREGHGGRSTNVVPPPDDLMRIRGVTRALCEKLHALGINQFSQIATWTGVDRREVSAKLGLDREISRQNWIEQAALLESKKAAVANLEPVAEPSEAPSEFPTGTAELPKPHTEASGPDTPIQTSLEASDERCGPATRRLPEGWIKTASLEVVGRLQTSDDGQGTVHSGRDDGRPRPVSGSAPEQTRQTPRSGASSPVRPSSQIAFSPEVVPEPRRVIADKLHATPQDRARLCVQKDAASQPVTLPKSTTKDSDRSGKDINTKVVPPAIAKRVLPKDKLRFRRLKMTSTVAQTPPLPESHKKNVVDESPVRPPPLGKHRQDGTGAQSPTNPLTPPPMAQQSQRALLKKTGPRHSNRGPGGFKSGQPSFGDGKQWRDSHPALTGPGSDEDSGRHSKMYAHTEEASVEIIHTGHTEDLSGDQRSSGAQHTADQTANEGERGKSRDQFSRQPAKRIFRALKRE